MKVEFEVSDYLTPTEIKKCIMEGSSRGTTRHIDERNFERLISNSAYQIVWEDIDNIMKEKGIDLNDMLVKKVINIIENLSSYNVFHDGDVLSKKSYGMCMVDEIVKDKKPLIEERVEQLIKEYSLYSNNFKDDIKEVVEEQILKCLGIKETEE